MADAYGRLTGRPGIAWVTGGPGHANAVGALFTALGQETPMVLLSGHTETDQLGTRRISGTAAGRDGRAGLQGVLDGDRHGDGRHGCGEGDPPGHVRTARTGASEPAVRRAGRDGAGGRGGLAGGHGFRRDPALPLDDAAADAVLGLLATAKRPLVIGAPAAGEPSGPRSAAPDRGGADDPDLHQRETARLQRCHPRRLRRGRQAHRPDRCCWAKRSISP